MHPAKFPVPSSAAWYTDTNFNWRFPNEPTVAHCWMPTCQRDLGPDPGLLESITAGITTALPASPFVTDGIGTILGNICLESSGARFVTNQLICQKTHQLFQLCPFVLSEHPKLPFYAAQSRRLIIWDNTFITCSQCDPGQRISHHHINFPGPISVWLDLLIPPKETRRPSHDPKMLTQPNLSPSWYVLGTYRWSPKLQPRSRDQHRVSGSTKEAE
ncbi:hypothetical protein QBC37DRAFT_92735 [Rhypophila decipiens]|uniref:Uncharacterized protein n=1 Tax=Rhypophila decipiens TaxID=261697 RepID=A0AAN7B468_9PEZI|nr:hypothetical protein QBC37DRAFT_92735 [Rhypophila decipiens]